MLRNFVLASVIALAGQSAQAATITINYQEQNIFGTPDYSKAVEIESTGYDGPIMAGPFQLTDGGAVLGDFIAFCIDLSIPMKNGFDYTVASASSYGAATDLAISQLFGTAYAGIDSAAKGAAFQIALWEIIQDTGNGYDLSNGLFQLIDSSARVLTLAQGYLNGLLGTPTATYNLTFLNSGRSQDLVTATPVPLPAAGGMLLAGLAGLGFLKRRKSRSR